MLMKNSIDFLIDPLHNVKSYRDAEVTHTFLCRHDSYHLMICLLWPKWGRSLSVWCRMQAVYVYWINVYIIPWGWCGWKQTIFRGWSLPECLYKMKHLICLVPFLHTYICNGASDPSLLKGKIIFVLYIFVQYFVYPLFFIVANL